MTEVKADDAGKTISVKEFSNDVGQVNFYKIFSGPLSAAMDAQMDSAIKSVEFIRRHALEGDRLKIMDVEFNRLKKAKVGLKEVPMKVQIPWITILPIPFVIINKLTVEFNLRITTNVTKKTEKDLEISGGVKAEMGSNSGKIKFSAGYIEFLRIMVFTHGICLVLA